MNESLEMLRVIVHAVDHDIFVRHTPSRFLMVSLHRPLKRRELLIHQGRHDIVSGFLNGGMQRYSQRELFRLSCELIYTLQKTARGDGDMTSSDIQSVGRIQESQSSKHVVVIEERLPLPMPTTLDTRSPKSS